MRRRVAVVGAGIVGVRTVRDLLVPPGPERSRALAIEAAPVVLVTRRAQRRQQLAAAFGQQAEVLDARDGPVDLGEDVGVVVISREVGAQLPVARQLLGEGRDVVCTSDDPEEVRALLSLDGEARRKGRTVLVGASMSPGWSCLLADHARTLLDVVDEVHVARHGAAGPACARQRLRALRGSGHDWRDGEWVRRPGFSGRELEWFPDPIGGRDCYRAELCEPLLLAPAFPGAQRITARLAASRRDRALAPFPVLVPPPSEGGLGAIRVELRGTHGGSRRTVVYGALDRPAVAAAAVAAVAARHVASGAARPGAYGLAELGESLALLTELARRGVRSATFEGGHVGNAGVGKNAESVQFSAPRAEDPT